MRIRDPKTTALIFASGKMVCTGAKSETDSKLAAKKVSCQSTGTSVTNSFTFSDFLYLRHQLPASVCKVQQHATSTVPVLCAFVLNLAVLCVSQSAPSKVQEVLLSWG